MSYSFSLFQASLVLTVILAGASALLIGRRGGGGRWPRNWRNWWKDDAAHRQGLVLIDRSGRVRVSHGAKLLLGGFSSGSPDRRSILSRFRPDGDDGAVGAGELEAALDRLLTSGAAFTLTAETKAGKRLALLGEPRGASVALTLHNITALHQENVAATARAAKADQQAKTMSRIIQSANAIGGRLDADGALVWRSDALASLPDRTCETLRRSAHLVRASAGPGHNAAPDPSDVVVGDVSYSLEVTEGPGQDLTFYAAPVQEDSGGEEAFRRFVNTMAETFAHLKVGLMIFDNDRRLTLFNPATVELFGGDAAWFARRPKMTDILDGMRETRAIPEQADFIEWRDALLAQFEGEEAQEYEDDWHLSDGRTIHVIARPHPSGGLAVTAEDISESVDLLRATAADKAVMLATTNFLEEAVIVFGPDGQSRLANTAFRRLWKFAPDDFDQPKHISDVAEHCIARGGGEAYWSMALDRITTGAGRRKALEKFSLAGGMIVQGRYSPMPDGSSLLVTSDITASENTATALRQRNEALEQADEIRGALVDQISHQMRTPLNAVSGFAQLLSGERMGALAPRQRTYVDGILQSSAELLDAINGMTDLITGGADSMSLDGEMLNPKEMLDEVLNLTARRFSSDKAEISIKADEASVSFRAHRIRLRQILFNILVDVLTKSAWPHRIEVAMELQDRTLRITAQHAPLDDIADEGLALSLVRRFAGLHDGAIEVTTTDAGRRRITCDLPECDYPVVTSAPPQLPLAAKA